jgi:hypothetical protein
VSRAVAEAERFLAESRGLLEPADVAWADQAAARLVDRLPLAELLRAWAHEPQPSNDDVEPREEEVLARVIAAAALVAKVRPTMPR